MNPNIATVVSSDNKIITINFSEKAYPEISRIKGRVTTQTTKDFLFERGYMNSADRENDALKYTVIVDALYRAFCDGALSLNATKQNGVKNLTPVRVSTGLSGKLDTVLAISTISLANQFCLTRMQKNELVCSKCYVSESLRIDGILSYTQNMFILTHFDLETMSSWIPQINADWAKNRIERELRKAKMLGKLDISEEEIARITSQKPLCRFESLGDLACTLQAENYLTIANSNPDIDFALWSKNPAVLAYAIDKNGKPGNLSTVWSMSRVNVMDKSNRYDGYFDHKFIVVDNDHDRDSYLSRDGFFSCHCGHFSCIRCRHCYEKTNAIDTAVERLRDKKQR